MKIARLLAQSADLRVEVIAEMFAFLKPTLDEGLTRVCQGNLVTNMQFRIRSTPDCLVASKGSYRTR